MAVLELRAQGLYCAAGDFFIDPWRPVDRAVLTHAHADHARRGHGHYLAQRDALGVLRTRLGDVAIDAVGYGEPVIIGRARVSLHPAGHVLGSSQVRVEVGGEIWVVTGDYKLGSDPTCTAFEPVRAHVLITESTFGLPVYRWAPNDRLFGEIDEWWRVNAALGRPSVIFAYAFGKAQRILASVDASIGPIVCHGAVEVLNRSYRDAGVALPATTLVSGMERGKDRAAASHAVGRALVVAPPSAQSTPWMRRFPESSDAFASGWMQLRGARRRRAVDRGFVLSDHADWPGLITAIEASGAQCVYATHGYAASLARFLADRGLDARTFDTREFDAQYGGEQADRQDDPQDDLNADRPDLRSVAPSGRNAVPVDANSTDVPDA